jgi:hypothetical protein
MYPEFPAASLILLSRAEDTNDVLLKIVREETHISAWLSAGNLLTERRARGFAATLLDDLTIAVAVRVIDPGGGSAPPSSIAGSCPFGAPSGSRPGWPDIGNYYVEGGSVSGASALLSRGPYPTFYTRIAGPPAPLGYGPDLVHCSVAPGARDGVRTMFLAQLAGEWPRSTVTSAISRTLTWNTATRYLRDLRRVIAGERAAVASLAATLVKAGLMTTEEQRAAQSSIVVTITDARRVRPRALPRLSAAGEHVRIESTDGD